jgi:hypothetical protein
MALKIAKVLWAALALSLLTTLAIACQEEEEKATPAARTPVAAQTPVTKEPVKVGFMYDATGATQLIGPPYKAGFEDAIKLINKKGGVEGHPIEVIFCEHGYEVPKGVECYERMKAQGVVIINTYGTPITQALVERCVADKIVCNHPGYGIAAAANGEKFPYNFPTAASYWSQGGRRCSSCWSSGRRRASPESLRSPTCTTTTPLAESPSMCSGPSPRGKVWRYGSTPCQPLAWRCPPR